MVNKQDSSYVGRIAVKNNSPNIAKFVEAYVEEITDTDSGTQRQRKNFLPFPLAWTHVFVGPNLGTIRDIQGNQTVYLDIFVTKNKQYSLQTPIKGPGLDQFCELTKDSKLKIKIYQESGQVVSIIVVTKWDGEENNPPTIDIINE